MGRQIIGHDAAAVRPADWYRTLEPGCVHHGLHLIAPGSRSLGTLGFERLGGIVVAAEVVGHHVEFLGEIAAGDLLIHDRWLCEKPWMKRISGPFGLPQSCAEMVRPSGVFTESALNLCSCAWPDVARVTRNAATDFPARWLQGGV